MFTRLLKISFVAALSIAVAVGAYAEGQEIQVSDPLEPMNRGIFWFNDKADRYLLEPVAEGYDAVVPDVAQRAVGNFFKNLEYPSNLLSNVVQFKFGQAGNDTGRFLINTVLGVGGLFDVATDMGLPRDREDFGLALAYHGVPAGPYLVIPILGPSNFRDAFGRAVDALVHPFSFLYYADVETSVADKINYGGRALDGVDTRAGLIDAIDTAREASLDYYLFVQGAYYQHREGQMLDRASAQDDNIFNDDTPISGEEKDPLLDDE